MSGDDSVGGRQQGFPSHAMALKSALVALLASTLTGCAVAYTFINSDSKLDRLAATMPKTAVVEAIGKPDLVLRDDGRITVWQYHFNTSHQWLYELSLCPVSVWVGGCLFYPFTNWVSERQREHAVHLILVNDRLCTWGPPVALMQKKKGCTGAAGLEDDSADAPRRNMDVIVTAYGPINGHTVTAYPTIAVLNFADAPEAPGSGTKVSGLMMNLLLDLDFTIVERAKLQQVLEEQVVQLTYSEEARALSVGRIAGAKAVIIGEVQQWTAAESERSAKVALSWRMVDVETGHVLFDGEGRSNEGIVETPENLARLIAHRLVTRFAIKTGLLGTGRIGVRWEWYETGAVRGYLVQDVNIGSPADSRIQAGDVVVACNGTPLASVSGLQDAKRACRVDAGQVLALDLLRGTEAVHVDVAAERRPGL